LVYTDGFSEEKNSVGKYLSKISTEKGPSVIPLVFVEFLVVDDLKKPLFGDNVLKSKMVRNKVFMVR